MRLVDVSVQDWKKMGENTELTEELLDYEEDEQQAPVAEDAGAGGDTKKVKGNFRSLLIDDNDIDDWMANDWCLQSHGHNMSLLVTLYRVGFLLAYKLSL